MGKGEIARNDLFLHFPQCFLHFWRTSLQFLANLKFSSASSFSMEESKICCFGRVKCLHLMSEALFFDSKQDNKMLGF